MAGHKSDGAGNLVADAEDLDLMMGSLPPIRGTWYFVDPTSGLAAKNGLTPGSAKATFKDAYDLCTSGAGDGVVLMSAGTTAAGCTSYLSAVLDFSKHGVTVIGLSSGTKLYGRARIANLSTAVNLAYLIKVSGSNNRFVNVNMFNGGSDAAALGCLWITGHRNRFENCHFVGAGHATPAAETGTYDLLLDGGQENTFVECAFGTDTIIRAAASGNIRVDGGAWRNRFYDCEVISYSATAGKGHVLVVDATAFSGWMLFKGCSFLNWNENGVNLVDAALIGTKPNSGQIAFNDCGFFGFTAVEGAGMSGCGFVANSAAVASGAGGLATSV
jgi:hypothetical protein